MASALWLYSVKSSIFLLSVSSVFAAMIGNVLLVAILLKGFSLAMIFGVVFGTYSSVYIANTILVRLKVSQKTILKEDEKA